MIGAEAARRRSAGVRADQTVQARAEARERKTADEVRAKSLGAHMIEMMEKKVEKAIELGVNRAYDWTLEESRFVQSMAFYDTIFPHFEPLGYTVRWEYNDDHGPDERGRVTFGVALTW